MNRLVWIKLLAISMVLSGCGDKSPEDVAKTFAHALSIADIDEAKEVTTEKIQKKIDRLVDACNESYYKKLTDEVLKVYKIMNSKESSDFDIEKRLNTPDIKKYLEEMKKSLTAKYGDLKKLPNVQREKLIREVSEKFSIKYFKPMMDDFFDTLKVEVDYPDEVKDILVEFYATESMGRRSRFMSKRDLILAIIKDGNFENMKNVTPECVAKYTEYDFIDSINFIEVKTESADEAVVRLELIDKKDKSNKVSVYVEKIKDEWKVSDLSLDL